MCCCIASKRRSFLKCGILDFSHALHISTQLLGIFSSKRDRSFPYSFAPSQYCSPPLAHKEDSVGGTKTFCELNKKSRQGNLQKSIISLANKSFYSQKSKRVPYTIHQLWKIFLKTHLEFKCMQYSVPNHVTEYKNKKMVLGKKEKSGTHGRFFKYSTQGMFSVGWWQQW